MKHYLLYILFLSLFNCIDIHATESNSTDREFKKYQIYTYYFIIKEFYNLFTTPYFFTHHTKMTNAKIACCKCDRMMSATTLWAYSTVYVQESLLTELLSVFYNQSIEELILFTFDQHQKLEIPCNFCKKYNGYYIPEQLTSCN